MVETGIIMWCLVAVAFVLILIYMSFNLALIIKKKKTEAAKPQLIIKKGYTRR